MSWKAYDMIVENTIKLKTKTLDVVNDLLVFNGNPLAILSDTSKSNVATYSSNKIETIVEDTYTASETLTNKKWMGNNVYRKVISTGPVSGTVDNSILLFPTGILGVGIIVSTDFSAKLDAAEIWMTSSYSYIMEDPVGEFQQIRTYVDGSNVALRTSANLSECYITIEYTKSV